MKTTIEHISGTGLGFPIRVEAGLVVPETGWDLIRSCIFNLLAFEFGERYFQPDFGCNLDKLLEEQNSPVIEAQLTHRLNQQITQWENRIVVTSITTERNLGELLVTVNVTLKYSNPLQTNTFEYTL